MDRYDPSTALIVVDMQNDFADPKGSLSVRDCEEIVGFVNSQVEATRRGEGLVVYTQDWHPPHTPHFAQDGGIWPVHCVRDTWGAELQPDLVVVGPTIRKGSNGEDGYSGFTMRDPVSGATTPTPLAGLLEQHGVTRVVVVGLATDYCVKSTALDAARLGFSTSVLTDGVRAVDLSPGDGKRAIEEMAAAGVSIVGASAATGT